MLASQRALVFFLWRGRVCAAGTAGAGVGVVTLGSHSDVSTTASTRVCHFGFCGHGHGRRTACVHSMNPCSVVANVETDTGTGQAVGCSSARVGASCEIKSVSRLAARSVSVTARVFVCMDVCFFYVCVCVCAIARVCMCVFVFTCTEQHTRSWMHGRTRG